MNGESQETSSASKPGETEPTPGVSRRSLLLVFVIGLVARVAVLPWAADLSTTGDESFYWRFGEKVAADPNWSVLRPPLWAWIVQLVRAVQEDPFAARALSVVLGSVTVPLVHLLAARIFRPRLALTAALIFALLPEHIGFSHYIWAETLLAFLVPAALLACFRFVERGSTGALFLGSFLFSVALLTKVFALVFFLAFVLTLLVRRHSPVRIATAVLVFLLLPAAYSVHASNQVGRRVVLSEMGLMSMRQAVKLDPPGGVDYQPELREERKRELIEHLKTRPLSQAYKDIRRQFFSLWTPNSYVIIRLFPRSDWKRRDTWEYGIPLAWGHGLALVVTLSYQLLMVLGLTGLMLGERSAFRTFSLWSLFGLSCTALFAFATPRYRLSFLFLLIFAAVELLSNPRACFERLRDPRRTVPLVLLLAVFAYIVVLRNDRLGYWS